MRSAKGVFDFFFKVWQFIQALGVTPTRQLGIYTDLYVNLSVKSLYFCRLLLSLTIYITVGYPPYFKLYEKVRSGAIRQFSDPSFW